MKTLLLILALAFVSFGQRPQTPFCELYPLRDAKVYFVIHNEETPDHRRKKIEKAMSRADDIKRTTIREAADFYIDFTEDNWMRLWKSDKTEIVRVPLVDSTISLNLPARANTTVVSAGRVTTARTVITPQRTARIYTPGDENEGSEILFRLKVAKKYWKAVPSACR